MSDAVAVKQSLLLLGIVLIGTAAQWTAVVNDSATFDESAHIVAAYSYWKTGDYRLNSEHPPLGKLICGLPLLLMPLRLDFTEAEWQAADEYAIGRRFLYQNTVPADRILLAARSMTIATTAVFGAILALWTRRRFGLMPACVAAVLFAFDPLVLAHGRYVTSDLYVTFFYFAACAAWLDWLATGKRVWLLLSGAAVGLSLASKYSGVLVYPALALLWMLHRPKRRIREFAPVLLLVPFLVVWSIYLFDVRSMRQDPRLGPLLDRTPGPSAGRALADVPVPAYYWLRGAHLVYRHHKVGQPSYLLGRLSSHGSRLYFPVVFAVKTPVGLLLLTALTMVFALRRREVPLVIIPALLFFAVACCSTLNIGARHILPVYPFLFVAAGACVERYRWLVLACVVAVVFESALAWPDHLGFFNAAAGGSTAGHRYALDSNIDWGQDLKRLAVYLEQRGSPEICLDYFGTAPPEYYGIQWKPMPPVRSASSRLPCIGVISVSHLWASESGELDGLKQRRPDARIGTSLLVFNP